VNSWQALCILCKDSGRWVVQRQLRTPNEPLDYMQHKPTRCGMHRLIEECCVRVALPSDCFCSLPALASQAQTDEALFNRLCPADKQVREIAQTSRHERLCGCSALPLIDAAASMIDWSVSHCAERAPFYSCKAMQHSSLVAGCAVLRHHIVWSCLS
jgi:hypothetical protein